MKRTPTTALTLALLAAIACLPPTARAETAPGAEYVLLPSAESPLVAIRLMFSVGSIDDPAGKEGLAALTGLMIGEAGSAKHTYSELADLLYPMAASISVGIDREVTVLSGEVHRDKLVEFSALLTEVVVDPGFREADFERNKEQLVAYLTNTLRATSDELLGLEAIQQAIVPDHPYGHAPAGTVAGLEAITLDDVRDFYRRSYTQARLMVGIAGGFSDRDLERLAAAFGKLPAGTEVERPLPDPRAPEGREFHLIAKKTDSVGIHFGYPLPINRSHPDYYPLMVANSYLGEHRTFHGRLMQQLRSKRGLNYGDYSYIEYWDSPPFTSNPSPNVPRRQQYFSVWVRPVVPDTAHFALRNALYEVDRLVEHGLTQEEFELARDFLVNYSKLWAQTLSNRLGFLMDSRYYGMEYYIDEIDARLGALTVEEVNQAVKKYIQTDRYRAVMVTDGAAAVGQYLEADEPSPMTYNSEVPEEVTTADREIEKRKVKPTAIEIVPIEEMFAGEAAEEN